MLGHLGCNFRVSSFARWTLFTLQLRRGLASWRSFTPITGVEKPYLHPRNPNELISKMAHIFEAGVIILGEVCRLANSGMLIP